MDIERAIRWLVAREYRRRASANVVVRNLEHSFESEVRRNQPLLLCVSDEQNGGSDDSRLREGEHGRTDTRQPTDGLAGGWG
jgi:hypothetical protein